MKILKIYSLYFSWVISFIASFTSLYYSEVLNYLPCSLCWYQRIVMYPLVLILLIAIYKADYKIYVYVLPLVLVGIIFSTWHFLEQTYPSIRLPSLCVFDGDCEKKQYYFMNIPVPFLSGISFVLIGIGMLFSRAQSGK